MIRVAALEDIVPADPRGAADLAIDGQGIGARTRGPRSTRRLAALAVAVLALSDFLALMGIGGLSLAWTALGLWLVAVAAVVFLAPPIEEDA